MVGVEGDLWRSSSVTSLLKQVARLMSGLILNSLLQCSVTRKVDKFVLILRQNFSVSVFS